MRSGKGDKEGDEALSAYGDGNEAEKSQRARSSVWREVSTAIPPLLSRWMGSRPELKGVLDAHHSVASAVDGHLWSRAVNVMAPPLQHLLLHLLTAKGQRDEQVDALVAQLERSKHALAKAQLQRVGSRLEYPLTHWGVAVDDRTVVPDGNASSSLYALGAVISPNGEVVPRVTLEHSGDY